MGTLLKHKKAQTGEDIIYMIVLLLGLGIGFVLFYYIYGQISTQMVGITAINETVGAVTALEKGQSAVNMLDYVLFVVLIAFAIAVIVLGYFVDARGVFMVIFLIILVIAVLLSVAFTYVWETFIGNTTLLSAAANFPITNFIMSNLAIYTTIVGALALFANYAKSQRKEMF